MSGRFYVKVHERGRELVLAVCDEEILGKKFEEGELVLEVKREFYGGRLASLGEVLSLMREATIINVVGERIVRELVQRNVVFEEAVIRIAGVPHLQIIKMI